MNNKNHQIQTLTLPILDKGYVKLISYMGNDWTPEETARISTGVDKDRTDDQRTILTRYLMRLRHTSPFEFVTVTFEVKAPLFVFREWHRHRTQSVSESSSRYQKLSPDYYLPDESRICYQAKSNHQGTDFTNQMNNPNYWIQVWEGEQIRLEKTYDQAINDGMAKELARINMPVSHYSLMRVSANLLNWYRFCQLREDSYAQYEIREYAKAIHKILGELFPECTSAYEDYWLNSINFSSKEREVLKKIIDYLCKQQTDGFEDIINEFIGEPNNHWTKREQKEFIDKLMNL